MEEKKHEYDETLQPSERIRPSDLLDEPRYYLTDEFLNNWNPMFSDAESDTKDPKKLLGKRIFALRMYRNMTQEEAATMAEINTSLWRHYEHGMKMPRQDRLEKIADALSVPVQMLQPINTYSPEGISTILYNMRMQCGNVEIVQMNGEAYIKIPRNDETLEIYRTLKKIKHRLDDITYIDAFTYYSQIENDNVPEEIVGMSKKQIEDLKACAEGKLSEEELSVGNEMLAHIVENTQWNLRNWSLVEFITELFLERD